MISIICDAINQMRLIEFTYHGNPRVVEPHTYGNDTKGHDALRAFQVGGYSSSGSYDWKMFHISKMMNIQISNLSFSNTRQKYKRNDSGFDTIYCQL